MMTLLLVFGIFQATVGAKPISIFVDPFRSADAVAADGSVDRPFPSLELARDALRTGLGRGTQRVVYLRGGDYHLQQPFRLDARDSGDSSHASITYRAYPGDPVPPRLTGGIDVPASMFKPVNLPSGTKGAFVVNLFALGLKESTLGDVASPYIRNKLELFYNGKPMLLARHPNVGTDSLATWMWSGYENMTATSSEESFMFHDTAAASLWRSALSEAAARKETYSLWLHGYWKYDWRETYVRVASVTPAANQSFLVTRDSKTVPQEPWQSHVRFYAVNALGLLDAPGEYFVSQSSGDLYFIPPGPPSSTLSGKVSVSTLTSVVALDGAKHVTFADLTFTTSQGYVVQVQNAVDFHLVNCTVSNAISTCASVSGSNCSITNCTVFGCGGSATDISGGDIHKLLPANNSVVGNVISDFARLARTYHPGVSFHGVGLYVAHNTISNGPHTGITGSGNNNLFEYNSISHVSYECTDTGAFYVGRSWSQRGNVARFNSFDTIRPTERLAQEGESQNAFYLDDEMSGWQFYGNTIRNSTTGVLLGGGRRNHIHSNRFIDCDRDIAFDARGLTWQKASCQIDCDPKLGTSCFHTGLVSLNYTQPPYSTSYPEIVNIYADYPCYPVGNVIEDNTYCHAHSKGGGLFLTENEETINSWYSSASNNVEQC